jgi:hypothetical protein
VQVLERADDRLEQRPALAHQHQHVAGARAAFHPALDVFCDLGREPHLRARFDELIEGRIPRLDLALVRGLGRVPDFHEAGCGVGERFMHGLDRVGGEAGKGLRPPEHFIDRTEHVWAGAERMVEAQVAKVVFDRPGERIERPVHDLEFARGRALERED